jgi:hypothetical protein
MQAGTGEAHASQTLSLRRSGTNELRNDCRSTMIVRIAERHYALLYDSIKKAVRRHEVGAVNVLRH